MLFRSPLLDQPIPRRQTLSRTTAAPKNERGRSRRAERERSRERTGAGGALLAEDAKTNCSRLHDSAKPPHALAPMYENSVAMSTHLLPFLSRCFCTTARRAANVPLFASRRARTSAATKSVSEGGKREEKTHPALRIRRRSYGPFRGQRGCRRREAGCRASSRCTAPRHQRECGRKANERKKLTSKCIWPRQAGARHRLPYTDIMRVDRKSVV